MSTNNSLNRWTEGLAKLSQAIACGLLVGIFVLINIEVLCRYLFSTSTLIADEYSAYFFAVMVYLGLTHSLLHNKLIKVDLPRSWAPVVESPLVRLLVAGSAIVFNFALTYSMYLTMSISARFQSRSIQPSQTVLLYPQTAVLVALGMALLASIAIFVRTFRNAKEATK